MDFLSHVAKTTRQQHFHLRVDVFNTLLYGELTALALLVDGTQLTQQHGQLVLTDETDAFEHGDMSHRAQHIIFS